MCALPESIETQNDWPKNVLVLSPHGTFAVPSAELRSEMRQKIQSLKIPQVSPLQVIQNFSDWATRHFLKGIPDANRIFPNTGRSVVDLNRREKEAFFQKDFGGIEFLSNDPNRRKIGTEFYQKNWDQMRNWIKKNSERPLIIFDLHDTDNQMIDQKQGWIKRENPFPEGILLCFNGGKNCPVEVLDFFKTFLQRNLKNTQFASTPIEVDTFYQAAKPGTISPTLADVANGIFTIEIEFFRGLYLDSKTQKIDLAKLSTLREILHQTMIETANKMTDDRFFQKWKK